MTSYKKADAEELALSFLDQIMKQLRTQHGFRIKLATENLTALFDLERDGRVERILLKPLLSPVPADQDPEHLVPGLVYRHVRLDLPPTRQPKPQWWSINVLGGWTDQAAEDYAEIIDRDLQGKLPE